MGRMRNKQTGFGIVELIVVIVVIGVLGATGWFVYQYTRAKATNTTGSTHSTKQQTNTKTQPDVYANWKTYCDTVYHYCFKYPQDWTFSSNTAAKLGDTGGASLLNPAKTVGVRYVNAYTQDSGIRNFMTVSLDKLTTANQDLTIVGGYIPSSGDNGLAGNNVPQYRVVDSSLLNTYPLAVGTGSQFPTNPWFTDQSTGTLSREGAFDVGPAVTINSLDETHAWFNSNDVKTGLLILKSFYYQPNP